MFIIFDILRFINATCPGIEMQGHLNYAFYMCTSCFCWAGDLGVFSCNHECDLQFTKYGNFSHVRVARQHFKPPPINVLVLTGDCVRGNNMPIHQLVFLFITYPRYVNILWCQNNESSKVLHLFNHVRLSEFYHIFSEKPIGEFQFTFNMWYTLTKANV